MKTETEVKVKRWLVPYYAIGITFFATVPVFIPDEWKNVWLMAVSSLALALGERLIITRGKRTEEGKARSQA